MLAKLQRILTPVEFDLSDAELASVWSDAKNGSYSSSNAAFKGTITELGFHYAMLREGYFSVVNPITFNSKIPSTFGWDVCAMIPDHGYTTFEVKTLDYTDQKLRFKMDGDETRISLKSFIKYELSDYLIIGSWYNRERSDNKFTVWFWFGSTLNGVVANTQEDNASYFLSPQEMANNNSAFYNSIKDSWN